MPEENGEITMRIAGIVRESIVDGPGIRFAVFCQGCPHHCRGCHNPETHDFQGGEDVSIHRILEEIDKNPLLKGVTFSGGEPLCQTPAFAALAEEVKKRGLTITLFTGYTLEQLVEIAKGDPDLRRIMRCTDLLIDGPYIERERDLTLQFRGSRNQRLIDLPKTREQGRIVFWKE